MVTAAAVNQTQRSQKVAHDKSLIHAMALVVFKRPKIQEGKCMMTFVDGAICSSNDAKRMCAMRESTTC